MRLATDRPGRRRAGAARPAGGFTILETVIALFIAMVVGFGAISLFLFAANYNAGASDRARALALAQQRLEEFRVKPYAAIAAQDATVPVVLGSSNANKVDKHTFFVNTKVAYYDTTAGIADDHRPWLVTVTVTPQAAGRWSAGAVRLMMVRASDKVGAN
jgi:Tfp pilus assembly protein PilV